MLGELLAYALGRAHGRAQARRRRRVYHAPSTSVVDRVCAALVLVSLALAVIFALASI